MIKRSQHLSGGNLSNTCIISALMAALQSLPENLRSIELASDDVKKLSNAWQRGKLVLNKDSAPYKSMLGESGALYSFVERSGRF